MVKRIVDLCLVVVLLLLMAWALIGEAAHEILGCVMLMLLLVHVALNWTWYIGLCRGTWSVHRNMWTSVNFLILACMLVSTISGILLSQFVLSPLGITNKAASARIMHLVAAYCGFCLMSMHLGMHWRLIIGAILNRRILFVVNAIAFFLIAYGFIAFIARGIGEYLFLLTQFVFFDYEEPLSLFLADYMAIMALFACLGAQLSKITGPASFKMLPRIRLLGLKLKNEEI